MDIVSDAKVVTCFEKSSTIKIWDLNSGDVVDFKCSAGFGPNVQVDRIKIFPNKLIMIVDNASDAQIYDLKSGLLIREFEASYLPRIEITSNDKIAFSSSSKTFIFNFATGKSVLNLGIFDQEIDVCYIHAF